jgi:hypothetical protein
MILDLQNFKSDMSLRAKKISSVFYLLGISLLLSAGCYYFFRHLFTLKSIQIVDGLLPGYFVTFSGAPFKREILIFAILQVVLIIGIFFLVRINRFSKVLGLSQKCLNASPILIYTLLVLIVFLRDWAVRYLLLAALISIFISWSIAISRDNHARVISSSLIKAAHLKIYLIRLFQILKININQSSYLGKIVFTFCLLVLIAPGMYAWHGLTLPNDYYEIQESYLYKNSSSIDSYLTRSEVEEYLERNKLLESNNPQYQRLYRQYFGSRDWSTETGRILYHHSYIYLPATHLLKYGLDNNIPFLYGYGNTLLHATFMSLSGGNLSAYFYTYPLVLLLGILLITLVVRYGATKKIVFIWAFSICLWQIYAVGFGVALLAASFSPARYIGLTFQVLSIIYFFRKKTIFSIYSISLAFLCSIVWNFEFSIIGLVGQILALLSLKLQDAPKFNFVSRITNLLLILVFIVGYMLLTKTSEDILSSVSLGFFKINMPVLGPIESIVIITAIIFAQLALLFLAFFFKESERTMRLCLLPILGLLLIKYLWNPAAPHLHVTLAFVLPMCLLYIPFEVIKCRVKQIWTKYLINGATTIILATCLLQAYQYASESNYVKKYVVGDFLALPWTELGETIPIVTPENDILQRVNAIKKRIQPSDSLLVLSPFDHLLSFYVNPKKYCGHFDLITNLTSRKDFEKIKLCTDRNPELLVVFDETLLKSCPDKIDKKASKQNCQNKLTFKNNVANVIKNISHLEEVDRDGDLIFYRVKQLPQSLKGR